MATVFMDSENIFPARDSSDRTIDGDRRSVEEFSGASPTLAVALGDSPQKIDSVFFGIENVASADILLDGRVVVSSVDYPKKRGFASFREMSVTSVSLKVVEKEDASLPVRVSEVVAGKKILELPDKVFLPDTTPRHVLRGSGVHEMLGGGLRPWSTVNDGKAKLEIAYTGSRWKSDRMDAFVKLYEKYRTFYFVRDTLSHPLDSFLAIFGNVVLPVPYSTGYRPVGHNVSFTVREV